MKLVKIITVTAIATILTVLESQAGNWSMTPDGNYVGTND